MAAASRPAGRDRARQHHKSTRSTCAGVADDKQRVGVSARFEDLRDTPEPCRWQGAMRGPTDPGVGIGVRRLHPGDRGGQRAGGMIKTCRRWLVCRTGRPGAGVLFETFGCGGQRWIASRIGEVLICHPTRCATGCTGSRNEPADPCPGQGTSPNYAWRWKYTAASSSRNPLTLRTSAEPPRNRGSIPHAGGSRHQHRCGAEIRATSGRHRSPQRRHAPDAAGQRSATPGNSISRVPCEMKNAPPAAGNTVGASSPVTGG